MTPEQLAHIEAWGDKPRNEAYFAERDVLAPERNGGDPIPLHRAARSTPGSGTATLQHPPPAADIEGDIR